MLRDLNGDFAEVADGIAGWDYQRDLTLVRGVFVDVAQVRKKCDLQPHCVLQLAVVVASEAARFRRLAWSSRPIDDSELRDQILVSLPARHLAGSIRLETELVLKTASSPKAFSAFMPGSRLGNDVKLIALEGLASRFPVESFDFRQALPHLGIPRALWYLSWDRSDLALPAMQALRLFLNSRFKDTVALASAGNSELQDLVSIDIARQLISGALSDEEFCLNPKGFPDNSVGMAAWNLIQLCFPGLTASQARDWLRHDPARFEAIIQSSMKRDPSD